MKKFSSILLIALFLFNFFGYRFVFNYQQKQADLRLEASLDKDDFNEADLITVTVPLSVPYQNNQQNFERVDGELKIDGKLYKYVKRKISQGQLVLLCLPNNDKMKLQSAKEEFFKYANDLVQNNSSNKSSHTKSGIFKNILGEYDHHHLAYPAAIAFVNVGFSILNQSNYLPSSPHRSPEQPPELA